MVTRPGPPTPSSTRRARSVPTALVLAALLATLTASPVGAGPIDDSVAAKLTAWAEGTLPEESKDPLVDHLREAGPLAHEHSAALISLLRHDDEEDCGRVLRVLHELGRAATTRLCATDPSNVHAELRDRVAFWLANRFLFDELRLEDLPESWRTAIWIGVRDRKMLPYRWIERPFIPSIFRGAVTILSDQEETLRELRAVPAREQHALRLSVDAFFVAIVGDSEESRAIFLDFLGATEGHLSERLWLAIAYSGDRELAEWIAGQIAAPRGGAGLWRAYAFARCGAELTDDDPLARAVHRLAGGAGTSEDLGTVLNATEWKAGTDQTSRRRVVRMLLPTLVGGDVDRVAACPHATAPARATGLVTIGTDEAFRAIDALPTLSPSVRYNLAISMQMSSRESIAAYALVRRWHDEGVLEEKLYRDAVRNLMRRDVRLLDLIDESPQDD